MFIVKDNNKPAMYAHCKVHKSWNTCVFDTFEEAEEYAMSWLGRYAPDKGVLQLNKAYNYSGYGDKITIQDLPNNCTCIKCGSNHECPYAFDLYNVDGDCLDEK